MITFEFEPDFTVKMIVDGNVRYWCRHTEEVIAKIAGNPQALCELMVRDINYMMKRLSYAR